MKPDIRSKQLRKRRHILLAIDFSATVERWVGIAEYAREAGWILEPRLFVFRYWGQHKEYLTSAKFDGILSKVVKSDQDLREIVANAGVPVVDMHEGYL